MRHDDLEEVAKSRLASVTAMARAAGLLTGDRGAVGARVHTALMEAAKARSGLSGATAVIEYALEDDYGVKLLALKGTVRADIDIDL
jgi:hypothetical protein